MFLTPHPPPPFFRSDAWSERCLLIFSAIALVENCLSWAILLSLLWEELFKRSVPILACCTRDGSLLDLALVKKNIKSGYFPYKETMHLKPDFFFLGANSCLVPIYIAEISPQNLRGKLGTLWQG